MFIKLRVYRDAGRRANDEEAKDQAAESVPPDGSASILAISRLASSHASMFCSVRQLHHYDTTRDADSKRCQRRARD